MTKILGTSTVPLEIQDKEHTFFFSRGRVTYCCLQNVALINELMATEEFAGQNKQVVHHYEKGLYQNSLVL